MRCKYCLAVICFLLYGLPAFTQPPANDPPRSAAAGGGYHAAGGRLAFAPAK